MSYNNEGYEPDQNYNSKSNGGDGEVGRRHNLSDDEVRSEKRRMMKNVICISFAFMLLFTAFQSMASLQSSINKVRQCTRRKHIVSHC